MAQTITKTIAPGSYPTAGVAAAWTAEIAGSQFLSTGNELLLVWNSSSDTPFDVTITSVADEQGRFGTFTEEIPFGELRAYGPFPKSGWVDASGYIQVLGEDVTIKFMVIQLP